MSIVIKCPRCRASIKLTDNWAGNEVKCTECGQWYLVEQVADENPTDGEQKTRGPRIKLRSKQAALPRPTWLLIGGVVLIFVLIPLMIYLVRSVVAHGSTPEPTAAADAAAALGAPTAPVVHAPPLKVDDNVHVQLMSELRLTFEDIAETLAQARDRKLLLLALPRVRELTLAINALTFRWEAAGFPQAASLERLREMKTQLLPIVKRMSTEANRCLDDSAELKLDRKDAIDTQDTIRGLSRAMTRLDAVLQPAF